MGGEGEGAGAGERKASGKPPLMGDAVERSVERLGDGDVVWVGEEDVVEVGAGEGQGEDGWGVGKVCVGDQVDQLVRELQHPPAAPN